MEKLWKKGDKVVRLYGRGGNPDMQQGDVATLSEDQKFPGVVTTKEFGGWHDPHRLRRLKDFPGYKPAEILQLYNLTQNCDMVDIVRFITKIQKRNARKVAK
jgi:hypothetical protein